LNDDILISDDSLHFSKLIFRKCFFSLQLLSSYIGYTAVAADYKGVLRLTLLGCVRQKYLKRTLKTVLFFQTWRGPRPNTRICENPGAERGVCVFVWWCDVSWCVCEIQYFGLCYVAELEQDDSSSLFRGGMIPCFLDSLAFVFDSDE
jgi:hypothetical protein